MIKPLSGGTIIYYLVLLMSFFPHSTYASGCGYSYGGHQYGPILADTIFIGRVTEAVPGDAYTFVQARNVLYKIKVEKIFKGWLAQTINLTALSYDPSIQLEIPPPELSAPISYHTFAVGERVGLALDYPYPQNSDTYFIPECLSQTVVTPEEMEQKFYSRNLKLFFIVPFIILLSLVTFKVWRLGLKLSTKLLTSAFFVVAVIIWVVFFIGLPRL